MRNLRSVRPLDAAIAVVAVLVLGLGAYLGISIWRQNQAVEQSAPVSRAIIEMREAIRENPDNLDLRIQLAQAYSMAGDDNAAIEQYEEVLKASPGHTTALSGLGFLASRNRDWEQAQAYWQQVVDAYAGKSTALMSKQYETANFYLGTALLEQKKYEEAVARFKEALRANKTASDTHFLLASAYRGLGSEDKFREHLEIALAFDPKMAEANYEYGMLLLADGDEAAAAYHFRVALDAFPDREEPQEQLEMLGPFSERLAAAKKLAATDAKAASQEARVAVALEPDNVEALMLLADLYEQIDENELALATYREALKNAPDNEAARAAVDRMSDGE